MLRALEETYCRNIQHDHILKTAKGEVLRGNTPFSYINREGFRIISSLTEQENLLFYEYIAYLCQSGIIFHADHLMVEFLEIKSGISKKSIRRLLAKLVDKDALLDLGDKKYAVNPTYFKLRNNSMQVGTTINWVMQEYPVTEKYFEKLMWKGKNIFSSLEPKN